MFADYVAYLAAQRRIGAVARSALPDAPIQPTAGPRRSEQRFGQLRTRLGADLRRLADRLDPTPHAGPPLALPRR